MKIFVTRKTFAVCRLEPHLPVPEWAGKGAFSSVTRTRTELSVVCEESLVPADTRCEKGWRAFQVEGPLDFGLTGILASIAQPLASAGISIFAVSTFDTDTILVKAERATEARKVLEAQGHVFEDEK